MFDQYSYKQKFYALLAVLLMLSVTAYRRSFSLLISSIHEHEVLRGRIDKVNAFSNNIKMLTNKNKMLDNQLGSLGIPSDKVQQGIVDFVTQGFPMTHIDNISPIHSFTDDTWNITSNEIDVTGAANELLSLSYSFEKRFSLSRVASMKYYTTKKSNEADALHLKIIFQNYESN